MKRASNSAASTRNSRSSENSIKPQTGVKQFRVFPNSTYQILHQSRVFSDHTVASSFNLRGCCVFMLN
ncbi:hypothetical protein P8452_41687 [Trifolium repens]|nr:hypothetical protein P8452_41687 [Trifolium repens]